MRTTLMGAAMAAISLTAHAKAEDIMFFEPEIMTEIVEELGWEATLQTNADGAPQLRVDTDEDLIIVLNPTACVEGGCVGLTTVAHWQNTVSAEKLEEFELAYAFVAVKTYGDNVLLTRYDISDYGMDRRNLKLILNAFADIAGEFHKLQNGG